MSTKGSHAAPRRLNESDYSRAQEALNSNGGKTGKPIKPRKKPALYYMLEAR